MSKDAETLDPLKLPVATSETIPGRTITAFVGPAFGVIARSMGFAKGLTGGIKSLRHGEVKEFSITLEIARHHAVERMIEDAMGQGADAVVAMRFDSGDVGEQQGMAEIVAYGTAVKLD